MKGAIITIENHIVPEKEHHPENVKLKYDIGDCVIHKSFGVGYIMALVEKHIFEDEARLYYEVQLEKATVWVPVDSDDPSPFRLLTNEDELAQYRRILTSKPKPLNDNFRARFSSVDLRLREGSLEAICEIVRDLTAREHVKHLSRGDLSRLQIAKDTLCKEWSASKDISLADAQQEIEALLQEGIRKNFD